MNVFIDENAKIKFNKDLNNQENKVFRIGVSTIT